MFILIRIHNSASTKFIQNIKFSNPDAFVLLEKISFFSHKEIPYELLQYLYEDKHRLDAAISELQELDVLRKTSTIACFEVPEIFQHIVLNCLSSRKKLALLKEISKLLNNSSLTKLELFHLDKFDQLLPHLKIFLAHINRAKLNTNDVLDLKLSTFDYIRTIQRNYHVALEFMVSNLPEAQLKQKKHHPDTAQLYLAGAGIYQWFGETQKSIQIVENIVKITSNTLTNNKTLNIFHRACYFLAIAYLDQGNLTKAKKYIEMSYQHKNKMLPKNSMRLYDAEARLAFDIGDINMAHKFLSSETQEIESIYEKNNIQNFKHFAELQVFLLKYKILTLLQPYDFLPELLKVYDECKSQNNYKHHRSVAFLKILIGKQLIKNNKLSDAQTLISEGIHSLEHEYKYGAPRRDLAYAYMSLGDLYYEKQDHIQAKQAYEQSRALYEKTLVTSQAIYEVALLAKKMLNTYIKLKDEFAAKSQLVKFKLIFGVDHTIYKQLNKTLSSFIPSANDDSIIHTSTN